MTDSPRARFRTPAAVDSWWFTFDLCADMLFILDVVVQFFTSVPDPLTTYPVVSKKRIAALYLRHCPRRLGAVKRP
jgi:hypothetical protein